MRVVALFRVSTERQAELGASLGIPRENIFILDNGDVLAMDATDAAVVEEVQADTVFVDGLGIGDVGQVVLRDRHHLAQDGFLVAIVALSEAGELLEAQLVSRGFVYTPDSEELLEEARKALVTAMSEHAHRVPEGVEDLVKTTLGGLLHSRTRRRPMILPVVMRV